MVAFVESSSRRRLHPVTIDSDAGLAQIAELRLVRFHALLDDRPLVQAKLTSGLAAPWVGAHVE